MRFTYHFELPESQAELDFVNVPLLRDIRLFLDPWAFVMVEGSWYRECHSIISSFFQHVLTSLTEGRRADAKNALSYLVEDNRIRMGYSRNEPKGSGLGEESARPFLDALEKSDAFRTGLIRDIEDASLFVDNIGLDIVSDMMANVLHGPLAKYTQAQCALLGITDTQPEPLWCWVPGKGWKKQHFRLPAYQDRSILLVPRTVVRRRVMLQPESYLTSVFNDCDQGKTNALVSLTALLGHTPSLKRGGRILRKSTREEIRRRGLKASISDLANRDPDGLKRYKATRPAYRQLTVAEIEKVQPEKRDTNLEKVVRENRESSTASAEIMREAISALVATFHPLLQSPRKLEVKGLRARVTIFSSATLKDTIFSGPKTDRHGSNVLVISTPHVVDDDYIAGLNPRALRDQFEASALVVTASRIHATVQKKRSRLADEGIVITSVRDIELCARESQGAYESAIRLGELFRGGNH